MPDMPAPVKTLTSLRHAWRWAALSSAAAFAALTSCGGPGSGSNGSPTPPTTPAPSPAPSASVSCRTTSASSGAPLAASCLSIASKQRLHHEYAARIADNTILRPNGGFDPRYYPGEVLASVLAMAEATNDSAMANWAVGEISSLHTRLQSSSGFLIWPDEVGGEPTFGELAQARLVLSAALIHRATGNANAKQLAMLAFEALERLPLLNVTSSRTGEIYRLPAYAYHNAANPVAISGRALDPNHDAVLAAAYVVMAKDVLDDQLAASQALTKARHYSAAATDLAAPGNCLPLSDDPTYATTCDSRYNGFWSALLELVVRVDPSSDALSAVDGQFPYSRNLIVAYETRRNYPTEYAGAYPDPLEPTLWLPTAARNLTAAQFDSLVARINAQIVADDPSQWPRGLLYPAYYQ